MEEVWKDVCGYEGLYVVSNQGRVISLERPKPYRDGFRTQRKREMRWHLVNGGYAQMALTKNGERRQFLVHRLVAQAFIPNLLGRPQVNHIDGNKLNNCVENLEWCTAEENMLHSSNAGLRTDLKPVDMFTTSGEYVRSYSCTKEAERDTGIWNQNISRCCNGKAETAGGYVWRFREESGHGR